MYAHNDFDGEDRWQTLGMISGAVVIAAHTFRDEAGGEALLISARLGWGKVVVGKFYSIRRRRPLLAQGTRQRLSDANQRHFAKRDGERELTLNRGPTRACSGLGLTKSLSE